MRQDRPYKAIGGAGKTIQLIHQPSKARRPHFFLRHMKLHISIVCIAATCFNVHSDPTNPFANDDNYIDLKFSGRIDRFSSACAFDAACEFYVGNIQVFYGIPNRRERFLPKPIQEGKIYWLSEESKKDLLMHNEKAIGMKIEVHCSEYLGPSDSEYRMCSLVGKSNYYVRFLTNEQPKTPLKRDRPE